MGADLLDETNLTPSISEVNHSLCFFSEGS